MGGKYFFVILFLCFGGQTHDGPPGVKWLPKTVDIEHINAAAHIQINITAAATPFKPEPCGIHTILFLQRGRHFERFVKYVFL